MSTGFVGESRKSTRIPLQILISVRNLSEPLTCERETITANRHGGLISSSVRLRVEMKIAIHLILTDKSAHAKIAYVDPERPRLCGIALEKAENIWGVSVPPPRMIGLRRTKLKIYSCVGRQSVRLDTMRLRDGSLLKGNDREDARD